MPEKLPAGRITVVEQVYHQSLGLEPIQYTARYMRRIDSEEQPYQRTTKAGPSFQKLDCGWIKEASLLCIRNEEGKNIHWIPTKEERQRMDKRVLTIAFGADAVCLTAIQVLPGESCRFCPTFLDSILIKGVEEGVRYSLTVIPA